MNISIFKKRLLLVWTVLLLLFKPSMIGERFNPAVYFLFVSITGLLFLIDPESKKRYMNKRVVTALLLILLSVFYFLFQGLLLSNAKGTVINSFVVIFGTSICIAYVSRKENVQQIFKFFINIFFVLSLSAIFTAVFFIFFNFNASEIPLLANLNFLVPSYFRPAGIYLGNHLLIFPFTGVWSALNIGSYSLPRFIGFFREPGMAQIFFLTAYFLTYFIEVKRLKFKRIIILIGAVFTFSTGGLLSFLGGFIMLKLFGKGKTPNLTIIVTTMVSLTIIIAFFATIPYLGFLNKISSESGKQRSESFSNSFKLLSESPVVGIGYYGDFKKNSKGVVVSQQFLGLAGVAYQIGIVGLILYSIAWYYGLARLGNMQTLCIYMPCLLTLMISQPSYNDVIVFFLILTDTSNLKLVQLKSSVIINKQGQVSTT